MKNYGSLKFDGEFWVIETLQPHVRAKLKAIFPKIGVTRQPPYSFNNTLINCADLNWFCQRYPLEISTGDMRLLSRQSKKKVKLDGEIEVLRMPTSFPPVSYELKNGYSFRPHQARNINLHAIVKGLLVADKVGLGKTLSALGTFAYTENIPGAIVVEPHLQAQWAQKADEFTHFDVHVIKGTRIYELPPAHIYIFRYSQLAGWSDFFDTGFFKSVVFDEIQNLRTGTESNKGSAAKILADHARARMGLSATPIYGYGVEIHNIYQFVSPDTLGDLSSFVREWCPDGRVVQDASALGSYLLETNTFTRHAVQYKENNVNSYVEQMPYDSDAVKTAEELAVKLAMKTLEGSFLERGAAAREFDLKLRQMTGIAKAKSVAQLVKMIVSSGEKVLLAGWHRAVYEIWEEQLSGVDVVMYTGSESQKKKQNSVDRFINGDACVFILSLKSGAGLDGLQNVCSNVVFGELDYSKSSMEQIIGRLDRAGQESQVTAIYAVAEYGSDPVMRDLIGLKASQARGIVEPGAGAELVGSDPDRIKRMARKYLEAKGVSYKSEKS